MTPEVAKLKLVLATAAEDMRIKEENLAEARASWTRAVADVESGAPIPDDLHMRAVNYRVCRERARDARDDHGAAKRAHDAIVHPINHAFPGFVASPAEKAADLPPQANPLAPMPR